MVEKSDIFADDYWKEQWKAVVAKEKTIDGDDISIVGMSVQLARRWGPKFCTECEPRAKKLLDLVDAAYKILSARREQMHSEKKDQARRRPTAPPQQGEQAADAGTMRVLEVLEDIRDGLIDLSRGNGRH